METCERPRTRLFASRALHRAETCEHVNARDAPQNASARVGMFASRLSLHSRLSKNNPSPKAWLGLKRIVPIISAGFAPPPDTNARLHETRTISLLHWLTFDFIRENGLVCCRARTSCGVIHLMEDTKLIYPEECYAIHGAIFEVYHELGPTGQLRVISQSRHQALGLLTKTVLLLKDDWRAEWNRHIQDRSSLKEAIEVSKENRRCSCRANARFVSLRLAERRSAA